MLERLQKIISRAGIASRRHAEQLIESGQVRVNGRVVTKLGQKADAEHDRIEAAGRVVEAMQPRVSYVFHKPPRVVATLSDPEGRHSLQEYLRLAPGRVYPVGRLDYSASGLLLLTNDGDLANQIIKVADRLPQTYWIKIKGRLEVADFEKLRTRARARVRLIPAVQSGGTAANPWYEAKMLSPRRDMMRRVLFEGGHPVEKLHRVAVANIELDDLPEGALRALQPGELAKLKASLERIKSQGKGQGPELGMGPPKWLESGPGAGARAVLRAPKHKKKQLTHRQQKHK
ncbi:MAG: S4 domain-containing protein [Candidatus Acidiferrales bacterium]